MDRKSTESYGNEAVSHRRLSSVDALERYRRKRRDRRKLSFLRAASLLAVTILVFANNVHTAPVSTADADIPCWQDPSEQVLFDGKQGDLPEDVVARNVYVTCVDEGMVVFDRRSDEKIAPASTAKMATALTAMELLSLDEEVVIGDEINLIAEESSRAWLAAGNVLTVRQLLVALLVPSGNDSAGKRILDNERASIDQAVDAFMERVNAKAEALGLHDSHFVVPDGFDAKGQYSTARDLAVLAKACLDNPVLAEIVATSESVECWKSGGTATLHNTNALIDPSSPYYMPEAIGVKTGNTDLAGSCLVSAALISGKTYICVVMGSEGEQRFYDSIELYEAIRSKAA